MNLSIIVPTLNEEDYLPLLLESIKKQNFKAEVKEDKSSSSPSLSLGESSVYEVIVADARSQDKTAEIAKKYGCKIVSGGCSPAAGRNEGAKIAQGEIFLFMDADNIYLPEKFFEKLIFEFKKRNLGVASFPIYPNGKKIDKIIYGIYNNFVNFTQIPFATNAVLVKREIFKKVDGFDEKITIGEDHYFVKQAAKYGKFGFIKMKPILTSSRRFEQDGRFKTYLKYLLAAFLTICFGPIKSDIFRYRFGHYKKIN